MTEQQEPKLFSMSLEGAKTIYTWMQEKPYKEVVNLMKYFESGKLAYETDEKKDELKAETIKTL